MSDDRPSVLEKSSIARARLAHGVGLRELARRLGVTPGAVSQMERSEARGTIQANTLQRALRAITGGDEISEPSSESPVAPFARREERVSYELHRAIAKKLIDDPERILAVIPANLSRMRERPRGQHAKQWLSDWETASSRGIGALIDIMLSTDERSIDLRQDSPFTGVLSQDERVAAIRRASR